MKITEATCVCNECLLKKKKMANREFRRFAYKAYTEPYSYLKHANS